MRRAFLIPPRKEGHMVTYSDVMNPARLRRVGACRKLTLPDEPDKA